jgi:hypothetical protein
MNNNDIMNSLSLMQEMLESVKTTTSVLDRASEDFHEGYIFALKNIVEGMRFELRVGVITGKSDIELNFLEAHIEQYGDAIQDMEKGKALKRQEAKN